METRVTPPPKEQEAVNQDIAVLLLKSFVVLAISIAKTLLEE
jgi:hypothetical protein